MRQAGLHAENHPRTQHVGSVAHGDNRHHVRHVEDRDHRHAGGRRPLHRIDTGQPDNAHRQPPADNPKDTAIRTRNDGLRPAASHTTMPDASRVTNGTTPRRTRPTPWMVARDQLSRRQDPKTVRRNDGIARKGIVHRHARRCRARRRRPQRQRSRTLDFRLRRQRLLQRVHAGATKSLLPAHGLPLERQRPHRSRHLPGQGSRFQLRIRIPRRPAQHARIVQPRPQRAPVRRMSRHRGRRFLHGVGTLRNRTAG